MSYSREFLINAFKKGVRKYIPLQVAAEHMIESKLSELDEEDLVQMEKFFNSIKFPAKVYRGLKLKSKDDVNIKNIGNNWTVDTELFHNPFSAFRGSNVIVTGIVDENQVDWPETVQNYIYYSLDALRNNRYPENELTIKKGQEPYDLAIYDKSELKESIVPDKPSSEDNNRYYWELESRAIKQPQDLLRKFKLKFPEQYEIWGETFEWMLEHNEESFIEPQNFALYLEYDLDTRWGYIAIVEFKTRYEECLHEDSTVDITDRMNRILDKVDFAEYTPDDYEAVIYDEVANELRPAGYNNDAIQKVVDTYIDRKNKRITKLSNLSKAKELLKDYIKDSFSLGSYYIAEDGTIYDLGNSGYGHAEVSALLDDNGLEVDYKEGTSSKFLKSSGWIRLNTNLNFIELPDTAITTDQEASLLLALDAMHKNFKVGDSIQVLGKDNSVTYKDCASDYILDRIKRYYSSGTLYENKELEEVYPQKGETKSDFINRFMRATAKEYPDVKQRYAVANSYWDNRDKKKLKESSDHTQKAIDALGLTQYKTRAGFMLKDGRMLDLTFGGNPREDHRAVQDAFDDTDLDTGSDYLIQFMNEGNIRLIPEIPGVDIATAPTHDQLIALKDYIQFWINRDRHFEVQISDALGRQIDWKEYNGYYPVSNILGDIVGHYHEGFDGENFLEACHESYLDPEEKFWDCKTGTVEPGQYVDINKSEIRWVDDLLDDPKYYAEKKGKVASIEEMTPEEYFEACADIFHSTVDAQKRHVAADEGTIEQLKQVLTKYKRKFPIPFINIADRTQEGRHRMYTIGEMFGWDVKVPVLVIQSVDNIRFSSTLIYNPRK